MPEDTKETPDWLKTPLESRYCLDLWNPHGTFDQQIDLTREEFIALKRHLCELRNIPVPESIGEE